MNLKSMSLDRLANLRDQVNSALVAKVADQRRTLESELSKISRFQVGGAKAKAGRGGLKGSSIAPKYRNPENATETWAGRGLKPRWLAAALKSGKKLEDFAIAGGTGRSKPAMRRVGGLKGSFVAPKYRNPENATETWAGRGLKPRWLAAALKSGKKLEDFAIAGGTGRSKPAMRRVGGLKGSFVAPKYRNPDNASETWAGRGLKPRWLAAALKSGKKQDDFLIAGSAPSAKANGRKKAGRPRK